MSASRIRIRLGGMIWPSVPDAQMVPSHLTAQGFYLMRARTQLYEVINILLK